MLKLGINTESIIQIMVEKANSLILKGRKIPIRFVRLRHRTKNYRHNKVNPIFILKKGKNMRNLPVFENLTSPMGEFFDVVVSQRFGVGRHCFGFCFKKIPGTGIHLQRLLNYER